MLDRDPNSFESPLHGIDSETFQKIYDEEMFDEVKRNHGMKDAFIGKLDTKKVE